MNEQHPSGAEISRFVAGRIVDEDQRQRLEEHLLRCDACCRLAEGSPTDDFQQGLARVARFTQTDLGERYELLEEVGRGGAGVVYRAKQKGLDRQIAVKMLLRGDRSNRVELSRFRRESMALARLHHPNVVQIYDCGEMAGLPFIAMEYVEGPTLAQRLQRGPLDFRTTARWIFALADAVAQAHDLGVFHRDLKPQNVLLVPGRIAEPPQVVRDPISRDLDTNSLPVGSRWKTESPDADEFPGWIPKIVDFGLAYCDDSDQFRTASGEILGTPAYLAPEAIRGQSKVVGESHLDIYGLGVIMYECLTGRPPFTGSSAWEILEAVANREPVSIISLRGGVPRDLATICNRAMDKRPERRFLSARDLANDLRRFLEGFPIHSRQISAGEKLYRWARRHPAVAAAYALAATLAVTVPVLLENQNRAIRRERNQAQQQYAAARETLHEVLAELQKNTGTVIPEATNLASRQVEHATALFERLSHVERSPRSELDLAKVLILAASTDLAMGRHHENENRLGRAAQLYQSHRSDSELQTEVLTGLFQVATGNFQRLSELEKWDEAERCLSDSLAVLSELEGLVPTSGEFAAKDLWRLQAELKKNQGQLAQSRRELDLAARFYQEALDAFLDRPKLISTSAEMSRIEAALRINLASVQMQTENLGAAEANYRFALDALEVWADIHAETSTWTEEWATAVLNRSNVLKAMDQTAEAFETLDRARPRLQKACDLDPQRVELRRLLFMVSANRALFCPDPQLKVNVWRDAVEDAGQASHEIYARQILVRVLSEVGRVAEAIRELDQVDIRGLNPQERFVQASCHALIGKHDSIDSEMEGSVQLTSSGRQSVDASWQLLCELLDQQQLTPTRVEHLKSSDDWSAVRRSVGEEAWMNLLGVVTTNN